MRWATRLHERGRLKFPNTVPMVMGLNRGRYFLLTGKVLGEKEAKEIGVVNEILPKDSLFPESTEVREKAS